MQHWIQTPQPPKKEVHMPSKCMDSMHSALLGIREMQIKTALMTVTMTVIKMAKIREKRNPYTPLVGI
jgi:ribosomal protein S2